MRTLLIVINVVAICLALYWCFHTDYDLSPVLTLIGLFITLVTIFVKTKNDRNDVAKNIAKIKGRANYVDQAINGKRDKNSSNQAKVDGDENSVKQKNS